MIDESSLRDVLVSIATEQKVLVLMVSAMLTELAAVRESVRGLDPTFSDVLRMKQQQMGQEPNPELLLTAKMLDATIEKAMRVVRY